jgi:uncharacterized protein (DUF2345 family)
MNEENSLKTMFSNSLFEITFDEVKKEIRIFTPSNDSILIRNNPKSITIVDQSSNSVIMSDDGITIKSPKNINIEAGQNLILKGAQGITVQSSGGNVQTSGINIKETAQSEYSAEGRASAKVQAGSEVRLKAAMVRIN